MGIPPPLYQQKIFAKYSYFLAPATAIISIGFVVIVGFGIFAMVTGRFRRKRKCDGSVEMKTATVTPSLNDMIR